MKWFKHYSDNYRGRSIEELHFQMGHTGIACYYLLTEICAEKLEKNPDKTLEISDCKFRFSQGFVRRNLRISSAKLEVFLRICSGLGLFQHEFCEKDLEIKYPILLDLLDSDSKKSRSRREQDATKTRLDKDIDKEVDVEEDKKSKTITATDLNNLKTEKTEKPHWFSDFVINEVKTLDTGIINYARRVSLAFINEEGFRAWFADVANTKIFKETTADGQVRYFKKALESELKNRGV